MRARRAFKSLWRSLLSHTETTHKKVLWGFCGVPGVPHDQAGVTMTVFFFCKRTDGVLSSFFIAILNYFIYLNHPHGPCCRVRIVAIETRIFLLLTEQRRRLMWNWRKRLSGHPSVAEIVVSPRYVRVLDEYSRHSKHISVGHCGRNRRDPRCVCDEVRTDGHLDEYHRFRFGRNRSRSDGAVTKPGLERFASFPLGTLFLTGTERRNTLRIQYNTVTVGFMAIRCNESEQYVYAYIIEHILNNFYRVQLQLNFLPENQGFRLAIQGLDWSAPSIPSRLPMGRVKTLSKYHHQNLRGCICRIRFWIEKVEDLFFSH